MVYAATMSAYQRVMHWRLILKEFGTNIQHTAGVDNIVSAMISRQPYSSVDKYETITSNDQCRANQLFTISRSEISGYCFPLNILNVKIEQKKELIKFNSRLSTYILDRRSGYYKQAIDNAEMICYYGKMYTPQTLHRRVLYWYHFYIQHPGGIRLVKTIL